MTNADEAEPDGADWGAGEPPVGAARHAIVAHKGPVALARRTSPEPSADRRDRDLNALRRRTSRSADRLAMTAVSLVVEVLNGRHVLVLKDSGWRLEHDLHCRLGMGKGCQFEGPLRVWLMDVGRPPQPPGRYALGLEGKRRGQSTPITLNPESEDA